MAQNGSISGPGADSTAPASPFFKFAPTNVRDMIQRSVNHTVNRKLDSYVGMSVGSFDGRFANNFPGTTQLMENAHGNFYHVVGSSQMDSIAVAAP